MSGSGTGGGDESPETGTGVRKLAWGGARPSEAGGERAGPEGETAVVGEGGRGPARPAQETERTEHFREGDGGDKNQGCWSAKYERWG